MYNLNNIDNLFMYNKINNKIKTIIPYYNKIYYYNDIFYYTDDNGLKKYIIKYYNNFIYINNDITHIKNGIF